MARWYVLNGPFDGKEAANRGRNLMIGEDGYSPIRLRVARLRDRTGPSVAARLAAVEERLGSHRERLAAVEDFTTELRAAEETTVHRIGNLEADILDHRTRIGDLEREPAPVRPEPGSVAEPTDGELYRRAQGIWNTTADLDESLRAIASALYNLGREHGERERTALLDACAADRAALLARAEKAESTAAAQYQAAWDALRPYNDTRDPEEIGDLVADIGTLVVAWQKRGEELEALRADLAVMRSHYDSAHRDGLNDGREAERADAVAFWETRIKQHPRGSSEYRAIRATLDQFEFGEHVGAAARSATRPSAPTPIAHVPTESAGADGARLTPSEAEMAAELREAGYHLNQWWSPRPDGALWYHNTADAYASLAAMRAAKGAK